MYVRKYLYTNFIIFATKIDIACVRVCDTDMYVFMRKLNSLTIKFITHKLYLQNE